MATPEQWQNFQGWNRGLDRVDFALFAFGIFVGGFIVAMVLT